MRERSRCRVVKIRLVLNSGFSVFFLQNEGLLALGVVEGVNEHNRGHK
jgi:hypothetical protein